MPCDTVRMQIEHVDYRGLPCVRVQAEGASVLLALQGAHLLSWQTATGEEQLFLSEQAVFAEGAAIRGGVPIIFPQFSERGPLRRHGFARTAAWAFSGVEAEEAVLTLEDNGHGFPGWPHPFIARLRIGLTAAQLTLTLEVENTGNAAFAFTAALHTYLRVAALTECTLEGLQGCDVEDSANGGTWHRQTDYVLTFDGEEFDRIYSDVVAPLTLDDGGRTLPIEQDGFADVVVWNPGAALATTLKDLAPGEHQHFLCVEAGQVLQPLVLAPGEVWRGVQRLG